MCYCSHLFYLLLKKNCWSIKNINLYKGENSKSFLNFLKIDANVLSDQKINVEMSNTVASGTYFIKLITNNDEITRKISFIK